MQNLKPPRQPPSCTTTGRARERGGPSGARGAAITKEKINQAKKSADPNRAGARAYGSRVSVEAASNDHPNASKRTFGQTGAFSGRGKTTRKATNGAAEALRAPEKGCTAN